MSSLCVAIGIEIQSSELREASTRLRTAARLTYSQYRHGTAPVTSCPERIGTYQNQQGKTVRGPEGEPVGHVMDLRNISYMRADKYKQHLYMILGRARSLKLICFCFVSSGG